MEKVPDTERIKELWAAIKTALAGKVDLATLEMYPTIEAMATSIAAALVDYAKSSNVTEEINSKIANALIEYVTKTEMQLAIQEAISESMGITFLVLDQLPEKGEEKVIYLVPSKIPTEENARDEYMWINGKWELIGTTFINVSDYWSKTELVIMTKEELEEILK